MTRAEKAGYEAYPENIGYSTIADVMYDYNAEKRRVYIAGHKQGYKDATDKACEFLKDRILHDSIDYPMATLHLIDDFKNYTEEKQ